MKKIIGLMMLFAALQVNVQAQERYGNTANLGLGIGYYGYLGRSVPAIHFNYEFDVGKNFTIAPFIGFHTYRSEHRWGNPNNPNNYYWYRQTVIPIGAKATYYFDDILEAGSDWDFYLAGSVGYALIRTTWSNNYNGDRSISGPRWLYWDAHIGAEYHVNSKLGIFLDLSTGVSTIGIAIHK